MHDTGVMMGVISQQNKTPSPAHFQHSALCILSTGSYFHKILRIYEWTAPFKIFPVFWHSWHLLQTLEFSTMSKSTSPATYSSTAMP